MLVEVVVADRPCVLAGTGQGPLRSVPAILVLRSLAPLCSLAVLLGAWLGAVCGVLAHIASRMVTRHLVHVSGLIEPCGQCVGRWFQ